MYIKKGDEYIYIKKRIWIPCVAVVLIATIVLTVMAVNPFGPTKFKEFKKFNDGVAMLEEYYYEDISTERLLDGALLGLSVSTEDPYTVYMSKEQAESFLEDIDSEDYAGVGLYIYMDETDNRATVSQPIEGAPAFEAGIQKDDKILAVDGESVENISIDAIAAKMKGPEGTEVVLTLLKAETGETVDVRLVRAIVERNTVSARMVTDSTACIQISQFGVNTFEEFVETFNKFAEADMQQLVIDLRNNPGGYMQEAVDIADVFLSEGVIVYTMDKNGNKNEYTAKKEKTKVPMVVLVNGDSASASEVLVGALRDHELAIIVGETTFGKGVTQITCEFDDGSLMKITDSRYYTPNGVCIDHTGIEPDVEVKMEPEKYGRLSELTVQEDEQLMKAIEILEQE